MSYSTHPIKCSRCGMTNVGIQSTCLGCNGPLATANSTADNYDLCGNCGRHVPVGNVHCPRCGISVVSSSVTSAHSQPSSAQTQFQAKAPVPTAPAPIPPVHNTVIPGISSERNCSNVSCKAPIRGSEAFCLTCGTSLQPTILPAFDIGGTSRNASQTHSVVIPPKVPPVLREQQCPNPSCGLIVAAGNRFCFACGTAVQ